MKNYKVKIENKSQFDEVIELAEKMGYKEITTIEYQPYMDYLLLKNNGMIHTATTEISNYEEITIEKLRKLAEPELKKVWAWDDNPEDAFETYLIKEFEKEFDYNGYKCRYLCVFGHHIKKYEKNNFFVTDLYANISETDPRTPNDVLKIIEKYGKDKLISIIEKL